MMEPNNSRERIVMSLKTRGPLKAAELGKKLGITAMAVRQHLYQLQDDGVVTYEDRRQKVGRPARLWSLTDKADWKFPNRHPELAVAMLEAIQSIYGEKGVQKVLKERTRKQVEAYRQRMPKGRPSPEERVEALARIRREDGYMAESRRGRNGTMELIENHCAVCSAARNFPLLCNGEVTTFKELLGRDLSVERVESITTGDRRCVYQIRPAPVG